MSNFLKTFEQSIIKYFTERIHLGSLTEKNILEMLDIQKSYLDDIKETLARFDASTINALKNDFLNAPKRPEKIDNRYIIQGLTRDTSGKAQTLERNACFDSLKKACDRYLKINQDIRKGIHTLLDEKFIVLKNARMSDIMLLGILREMDVFARYTGYLLEYFTAVVTNGDPIKGYRQEYLADNYEKFIRILNDICNKDNNYSFLKEVDTMRRNAADMVLYANGNSFTALFDWKKYTSSNEFHMTHGLFGFGIFTWIIEKWDMWKHAQIQKTKMHGEWLRAEQARLLQKYNEQDMNSPEGQRTQQLIEAYNDAITDLDQKINEYEHVEDEE